MNKGHIRIVMSGAVAGVSKDDRVIVNDVDITNAVTALEIPYTEVGDLLRVNVSLLAQAGVQFDNAARIGLTTATEAALEAMRWIPPILDDTITSAKGQIMVLHAYNDHGQPFSTCNTCALELQEIDAA